MDDGHILGQGDPNQIKSNEEYADAQNHMWDLHFRCTHRLGAVGSGAGTRPWGRIGIHAQHDDGADVRP